MMRETKKPQKEQIHAKAAKEEEEELDEEEDNEHFEDCWCCQQKGRKLERHGNQKEK